MTCDLLRISGYTPRQSKTKITVQLNHSGGNRGGLLTPQLSVAKIKMKDSIPSGGEGGEGSNFTVDRSPLVKMSDPGNLEPFNGSLLHSKSHSI